MLKVMEQNPVFTVRISANGENVTYRSSLVMVGNNAYRMEGLDAGSRESLTGGVLGVYVVQSEGKLALARLIWQIITGRAEEGDELEVHHVVAATVETGASTMPVARDGEVAQLTCHCSFGYGRKPCS